MAKVSRVPLQQSGLIAPRNVLMSINNALALSTITLHLPRNGVTCGAAGAGLALSERRRIEFSALSPKP
jgi:hypothetical protein